jgi:ABC-type uncharacterized transport system substrate-binding protein
MISSIPDASTSIAATVLPSPVRRMETAFEIHHLASDAAGVLVDANNPEGDTVVMRDTQERARAIGWQIVVAKVAAERDFDLAFATLVQQRASALLVTGGPFFNGRRRRIAVLAIRHAIPAIYAVREYVEAGGLMSYGSQTDAYRGAGAYVGRILKGANRPSCRFCCRPSSNWSSTSPPPRHSGLRCRRRSSCRSRKSHPCGFAR